MKRLGLLPAILAAALAAGPFSFSAAQTFAPAAAAAPLGFAPASAAWGDAFAGFTRWLDTPEGSATLGRDPLFTGLKSLDFRSEEVRSALEPLSPSLPEGFMDRMDALKKDAQRGKRPKDRETYSRVIRDAYAGFGERILMAAKAAGPVIEEKLELELARARASGSGAAELGALARQAQALSILSSPSARGARIAELTRDIRSDWSQALVREGRAALEAEGGLKLGEVSRGEDGRWPVLRPETGGHALPMAAAARHIESKGVVLQVRRMTVEKGDAAIRPLERGAESAAVRSGTLAALRERAQAEGLTLHDKLVHAWVESESVSTLGLAAEEVEQAGLSLGRPLKAEEAIRRFKAAWLKRFSMPAAAKAPVRTPEAWPGRPEH